jgi:hypothetical protein
LQGCTEGFMIWDQMSHSWFLYLSILYSI